jgi:hypothetical protein
MMYLALHTLSSHKDYKQILKNTFQTFNPRDFIKFLENEIKCNRIKKFKIESVYDNEIISVIF